jgi:hypothetical protein
MSEMSRNLTEAAKGAGDVAQNTRGISEAAQNTSHGAADSQKRRRSSHTCRRNFVNWSTNAKLRATAAPVLHQQTNKTQLP